MSTFQIQERLRSLSQQMQTTGSSSQGRSQSAPPSWENILIHDPQQELLDSLRSENQRLQQLLDAHGQTLATLREEKTALTEQLTIERTSSRLRETLFVELGQELTAVQRQLQELTIAKKTQEDSD